MFQVRGSTGYGKQFEALDNGYHREDAVKDIGALLEWVRGTLSALCRCFVDSFLGNCRRGEG